MKTSTEIAVDWLPILLTDDHTLRTTAFMQDVAEELLKQAGEVERLQAHLDRIYTAVGVN